MSSPKQWYGATLRSGLLTFSAGEEVYFREGTSDVPLKGGRFFIVVSTDFNRSIRLFEELKKEMVAPWPNRVNPRPAPEKRNEQIEIRYRQYLVRHPPHSRYTQAQRARRLRDQVRLGAGLENTVW